MEQVIPFKNIVVSDDLDELMTKPSMDTGTIVALLCRHGSLHIAGTEEGVSYDMCEHDVLLCTPDFLRGRYRMSGDFGGLVFCVPQNTLDDVVYSCLRVETNWYDKLQYIRSHPIVHLSSHQVALYEAYERLVNLHIEEPNLYRDKISDALAHAIIFEMLHILDSSMQHSINKGEAHADILPISNKTRLNQLFYQFVQLLEANHTSRRYVRWYANEMAITPKYLTYICNQVAGKTPTDIINAVAMRETKQILLYTNDTIKEIAYAMNYASASSFCKYFRQQTGVSPQAYRQQNRRNR